MIKGFKCYNKKCKFNKNNSDDITHYAGIVVNDKKYCLECAIQLGLIYIDYEKPQIRFNF